VQSTTIIALVIAAIVVTAAVFVANELFVERTADATRDSMMSEMKDLAGESLKHYTKPSFLGGGGKSFKNLDRMRRKNSKARGKADKANKTKNLSGTEIWETELGIYNVVVTAQDSAVIEGVGDVLGRDGENPVTVQIVIKKDTYYFVILN